MPPYNSKQDHLKQVLGAHHRYCLENLNKTLVDGLVLMLIQVKNEVLDAPRKAFDKTRERETVIILVS